MQRREPFANGDVIDLFEVRRVPLAAPGIGGRKMIEKLMQIAFVVSQSMDADIALVAQVIEELVEELVDHDEINNAREGIIHRTVNIAANFFGKVATLSGTFLYQKPLAGTNAQPGLRFHSH